MEVIDGLPGSRDDCDPRGRRKLEYSHFSRLIDVCCIAEMLRNFPITSLRGMEIDRFIELQNYFIDLEAECFDEMGFE